MSMVVGTAVLSSGKALLREEAHIWVAFVTTYCTPLKRFFHVVGPLSTALTKSARSQLMTEVSSCLGGIRQ